MRTPFEAEPEALRARLAARARPLHELTVAEARAEESQEVISQAVSVPAVGVVRDIELSGVPARLYLPDETAEAAPVVVWFHGGGWVLGSIEANDKLCRTIAATTPCAVVSIGYRLAPEHPFPCAVEDCIAATRAVHARASELGVDPGRIAVAGASAGGNLAAVVAQLARGDGGPPLVFQLLVYPVTDRQGDTAGGGGDGFFSHEDLEWCWRHYLTAGENGFDPRASPLRAGSLAGLPPGLVITAGLDPLREQGREYAARLEREGAGGECLDYAGLPHGFFSMSDELAAARDAQERACRALGAAFAAP
jgi:acetyl esterase